MRITISLFLILTTTSLKAEVDLGNLVIEGEVRRPMLRKIESKNATKRLLIEKAKDRMLVIEQDILSRDIKKVNKEMELQQKEEIK